MTAPTLTTLAIARAYSGANGCATRCPGGARQASFKPARLVCEQRCGKQRLRPVQLILGPHRHQPSAEHSYDDIAGPGNLDRGIGGVSALWRPRCADRIRRDYEQTTGRGLSHHQVRGSVFLVVLKPRRRRRMNQLEL
jgi:hypothetical protein